MWRHIGRARLQPSRIFEQASVRQEPRPPGFAPESTCDFHVVQSNYLFKRAYGMQTLIPPPIITILLTRRA
jgi:hypothetical protein